MRRSIAESVLALFTSRENATSIVGDLAELSVAHWRGWFSCQVGRLALAFWTRGLVTAPLPAAGYAVAGFALYLVVYVVLFIASGLPWYPWHRVHEPGFLVRACLVAFCANLLTGAVLGGRPPWRGATPVGSLVAFWIMAWLVWPFFAWRFVAGPTAETWQGLIPWPPLLSWPWTIVLAYMLFPLLYLVPLLTGAVLGQERAAKSAVRHS